MVIYISALFIFFSCFVGAASPESRPNVTIAPPEQIEHEHVLLKYNKAWKDRETYLETNLDDDSTKEILISFIGTYYPYTPNELKSDGEGADIKKEKQTLPIENHAFYQIYDKGTRDDYKLVKTFIGMDQLGKIEIFSLEQGKPPAIAIFNPCGANSTDLTIYQYREGGYRLIFNETSSSEIHIDSQTDTVIITIGSIDPEHPEPTNNMFIWDPQKDSFVSKAQE